MKQETFRRELTDLVPEVPEVFHQRVEAFLKEKVDQEVNMKESTKRAVWTGARIGRRALVLALIAVLALSAVALAAREWGIFEALGVIVGKQPPTADSVLHADLYHGTVNGVEITVKEAGYDGKTLFLQYSYILPAVTEPLEDLGDETFELLDNYNVGNWVDAFWINGECMDMANNSGAEVDLTDTLGEIVRTEYWWLDNIDVHLDGEVTITLPIGERQDLEYRKSLYDREANAYRLPDKGVVTFTMDLGNVQDQVVTLHPGVQTVTPDVTVSVSEATFTPMMTYITLEMEGNPDSLAAYRAENGEGYTDAEGNLTWAFSGMDVYGIWVGSLELVDGQGQQVFPDHCGMNGYSDNWAEFTYPYMDPQDLPDELWMASMLDGTADMTTAVRVR